MTQKTKNKEGEQEQEVTLSKLKEWFDIARSHYKKEHLRLNILHAVDSGSLWKAIKARFPAYQILPDTNFISYVKTHLTASIYTVAKGAEIQPTSESDVSTVSNINIALERIWDKNGIGYQQFLAGERAALCNLGITQVGWDEELTGGTGDSFYKGNVTVKNVDPMKFMRDPFAVDLKTSEYCITYEYYHKTTFEENPNYREAYEKYRRSSEHSKQATEIPEYRTEAKSAKGNNEDYDALIIIWYKKNNKLHEVHTVNLEEILYKKSDIYPKEYPFALLYCNLPVDHLIGVSEPAKIFSNSLAYNIMDSIALTAEYKNQRPPKFISSKSGLNIQNFAKHGDDAERAFVVHGPANEAVHYHKFPDISPNMQYLKRSMAENIQLVTGVDGRYTGRDTGSIITTGGTEEMLNRVTLVDTPKIVNYEEYAKQLTHLILANFINHSNSRQYFYKKPDRREWDHVTIDFPKIDKKTLFDYTINISSELPKNKQRLAEMANMLMEKQMQYRRNGDQQVQLITEEEWLRFQDIPNKEYMLERMGVQRLTNAVIEASQVIHQYAEGLQGGLDEENALLAAAKGLSDARSGRLGQEEGPIPPAALERPGQQQLPPEDLI